MSYRRIAYSPNGSGTQRAVIKLGTGDWEITQLSVVMGGKIPALNGMMLGSGYVAFQTFEPDETTVKETYHLLTGRCTQWHPMIVESSKMVKGPGKIRSTILHLETTEHTLAVNYRRVRD